MGYSLQHLGATINSIWGDACKNYGKLSTTITVFAWGKACHRIHLGPNSLLHDQVNRLHRAHDAITIHIHTTISDAGTGACTHADDSAGRGDTSPRILANAGWCTSGRRRTCGGQGGVLTHKCNSYGIWDKVKNKTRYRRSPSPACPLPNPTSSSTPIQTHALRLHTKREPRH